MWQSLVTFQAAYGCLRTLTWDEIEVAEQRRIEEEQRRAQEEEQRRAEAVALPEHALSTPVDAEASTPSTRIGPFASSEASGGMRSAASSTGRRSRLSQRFRRPHIDPHPEPGSGPPKRPEAEPPSPQKGDGGDGSFYSYI